MYFSSVYFRGLFIAVISTFRYKQVFCGVELYKVSFGYLWYKMQNKWICCDVPVLVVFFCLCHFFSLLPNTLLFQDIFKVVKFWKGRFPNQLKKGRSRWRRPSKQPPNIMNEENSGDTLPSNKHTILQKPVNIERSWIQRASSLHHEWRETKERLSTAEILPIYLPPTGHV